jgi:hypothetical protein
MTLDAETDFHAMLLALMDEQRPAADAGQRLQQLVEAARRLDQATTTLAPPAWELPPPT